MIIGNLIYDPTEDSYTGTLTTLTLGNHMVEFQPSQATAAGAPAYRVVSSTDDGDVEFGAAWKQRSKEGNDYLSVKLDDPTLGAPFNCAVVATKDSAEIFLLVWSRKKPDDGKTKPVKKTAARKKAA